MAQTILKAAAVTQCVLQPCIHRPTSRYLLAEPKRIVSHLMTSSAPRCWRSPPVGRLHSNDSGGVQGEMSDEKVTYPHVRRLLLQMATFESSGWSNRSWSCVRPSRDMADHFTAAGSQTQPRAMQKTAGMHTQAAAQPYFRCARVIKLRSGQRVGLSLECRGYPGGYLAQWHLSLASSVHTILSGVSTMTLLNRAQISSLE